MHTSLCTEILVAASEASSDIFQTGSLWSHSQCPVGSQMPGQKIWMCLGGMYKCMCLYSSLAFMFHGGHMV